MNRAFNLPFVLLFTLLVSSVWAQSQSEITIRGRVSDRDSGAPLPSATVSIRGRGLGTITNDEGNFEFHVPKGFSSDTLYVSMLGYAQYEELVRRIPQGNLIQIKLREAPILLAEVVIEGDSMSANNIFKTAYANLSKTFPKDEFLLKGFYRQINTENGKNVLLIEAAVEIFDKSYQLNPNFNLREKVVVNQVRSSNSFFQNPNPNYFEQSNTLATLLLFNFTRYENKYAMERENYTLDSVMVQGDDVIYIISSMVDRNGLINCFTFHINSKNFSFLKIKNETTAKKGQFLQNFEVPVDETKVLKLVASSQTYQFKEFGGRMYLEQATSLSKGQIINIADKKVEWEVTDENQLVVTEVLPNPGLKPPKKGLMNRWQNMKFLAKAYDPQFWQDVNEVRLTPLTTKQATDLEAKQPLEEQFKAAKVN